MNGRTATRADVDHYGAQYSNFASTVFEEIRREVFGEDIGQNGWITADEQDRFITWLELEPSSRLLDVACGSGGPVLRIAALAGCGVDGVDLHRDAIETATVRSVREGLTDRARFHHADANEPLPFADATFDALTCVDALNHLVDRARVFREWARVLKPGGRAVFTDPVVVTGLLTNHEIAIRSSIGFFLFAAPGVNTRLLKDAGFDVRAEEDRTANMASMAGRWHEARRSREASVRSIEGDQTFEGQQEFFRIAALLAAERRLSRLAYVAVKRG